MPTEREASLELQLKQANSRLVSMTLELDEVKAQRSEARRLRREAMDRLGKLESTLHNAARVGVNSGIDLDQTSGFRNGTIMNVTDAALVTVSRDHVCATWSSGLVIKGSAERETEKGFFLLKSFQMFPPSFDAKLTK